MDNTNYIVAVEIGSSKIKGAVGVTDATGTLLVKGIEEERQHPNYVRYGCVHNIKEVAAELNRMIAKLNNRISPAKVSGVYVGVGGRSLRSTPARLTLTLAEDTEVTPEIVANLLSRARLAETDRELLDVEPVSYQVDGKDQGSDAVGILGHDIAANVNIVNCRAQMIRNLHKVISEKLELRVNGYVVRPMALADMVLSSEERRLGTMLVDCGAETTTVAIYRKGTLVYLATIPLGSRHITRDITMSMPYLEERAEELKRAVGNASGVTTHSGAGMEEADTVQINNIVSARALEIIVNVNAQIEYAGLTSADLPGGIVLVGGGAMLQGFAEELGKCTTLSVRRGSLPTNVRVSGSKISTGEDLDVISLLYRLSQESHLKPCTVMPEPVKVDTVEVTEVAPVAQNETQVADTDIEYEFGSDIEDEEEMPKKKKGSSWSSIFKKITDSFKPTDDLGNYDEE